MSDPADLNLKAELARGNVVLVRVAECGEKVELHGITVNQTTITFNTPIVLRRGEVLTLKAV